MNDCYLIFRIFNNFDRDPYFRVLHVVGTAAKEPMPWVLTVSSFRALRRQRPLESFPHPTTSAEAAKVSSMWPGELQQPSAVRGHHLWRHSLGVGVNNIATTLLKPFFRQKCDSGIRMGQKVFKIESRHWLKKYLFSNVFALDTVYYFEESQRQGRTKGGDSTSWGTKLPPKI